ncbi:sister chromatid cohesion protein/DNA polymerase eta Eso1 [Schizosaccharomyces japonicus yFS275]|uniref:Sister chromatid cohesion protein/DNA polymerase eta Eso1 n=1 Tax=Schizosaccharomyces japonicus (strain yFS275 / FY16936) TaxID=402676 RepID=B6K7S5_SCHJY|nr:sister chromatid cohesion protein/DNA polymerase eta Eso1 [Schizosaccharomyces japonicus yFS275]EEB09579.1 sister chromatid cohesion protein/DNA polymerase eta Eso1 [Schizosaccharomyces japonicus yFS275]
MDQTASLFTWKDFVSCSNSTISHSPFKVVVHVDQDAFYAQVETVRLKLDHSVPLAVQQWDNLIAVNYAARPYGITRFDTAENAKKKCPELNLAHVQTWKVGEREPKYHEKPEWESHKVCLDMYRNESKKILGILSKYSKLVKKASIDESFVDLTAEIKKKLIQDYSFLGVPPEDLSLPLPTAPTVLWTEELGRVFGEEEGLLSEAKNGGDWDEVFLHYGARIVKEIRNEIFNTLGYTCSAGISRNAMLSKILSSKNKPNKQTVLLNSMVDHYLADVRLSELRLFGGKYGEELGKKLNAEYIKDIRAIPMDELIRILGDRDAQVVWNVCNGIDNSEITNVNNTQSMLSAKNFLRSKLKSSEEAMKWFRVFASDLMSRYMDVEQIKRPKTFVLNVVTGNLRKGRSIPIAPSDAISEEFVYNNAAKLLAQLASAYDIFPIVHLSVSFRNFEDRDTKLQGIESFMQSLTQPKNIEKVSSSTEKGIGTEDNKEGTECVANSSRVELEKKRLKTSKNKPSTGIMSFFENSMKTKCREIPLDDSVYYCEKCSTNIPWEEKQEHDDYHFALEISKESDEVPPASSSNIVTSSSSDSTNVSRPRTYGRKTGDTHAKPTFADTARTGQKRAFMDAFLSSANNSKGLLKSRVSANDRRHSKTNNDMEQLHIDLVNARQTCPECYMEYTQGNEDDENLHSRYHSKIVEGLQVNFTIDPVYTSSASSAADKVYLISSSCNIMDQKKAEDLLSFVNSQLSSSEMEIIGIDGYQSYLYVRRKHCIGFLLVEKIENAYTVPDTEPSLNDASSAVEVRPENKSTKFVLGISRIWVNPAHRHKGIASKLIQCARENFIYGYQIPPTEIAFSQPSESGKRFITTWVKQQRILFPNTSFAVYDN